MNKDYYIEIISASSGRYGDRLLDFMEKYGLWRLKDATVEQLKEYVEKEVKE